VTLIRDARPDEALALEALQRRSSDVWEDDRASLAEHPDAIEPPHQAVAELRVRVAVETAGELLGFSIVLPVRDGRCANASASRPPAGPRLASETPRA
jgi:hypothetical protein